MKKKNVRITKASQFEKAFKSGEAARNAGKQVIYQVAAHLIEEFLKAIKEFFDKYKVTIETFSPSGVRKGVCTFGGASLGALAGAYWWGGPWAIAAGVVGGALSGYAASHLTIVITEKKNGAADFAFSPA
ncbi:MAG: hypothetical protein KC478_10305 [Bacteriovoracaceae bacterium]|nr:hypothetical protein [Bacteriovoracaceae bacterium]